VLTTAVVYGVVTLIVKMDDVGVISILPFAKHDADPAHTV